MGASVTFWEATAPVKLPARRGPPAFLGLGPEVEKGGISRTAPPGLASGLHSLPPILHIAASGPTPRCSKAPRGLFVLPRVTSIFTRPSISPSPWSRQRPSRYAIPAGRNLPDKGFRYLRTVIVTAAVHRGFGLELITPPLNLPALGRRQPLYSALRLQQGPVFLLNSRQGLFAVAPEGFLRKGVHLPGRPFSRSYGANLPSSLTRVFSSALGRLPQPTSVGLRYGHPCTIATRLFLPA